MKLTFSMTLIVVEEDRTRYVPLMDKREERDAKCKPNQIQQDDSQATKSNSKIKKRKKKNTNEEFQNDDERIQERPTKQTREREREEPTQQWISI